MARTAGIKKKKAKVAVARNEEEKKEPKRPREVVEPTLAELDRLDQQAQVVKVASDEITAILDKLDLDHQEEVDLDEMKEDALWVRARWLCRIQSALHLAEMAEQHGWGLRSAIRNTYNELVWWHCQGYPCLESFQDPVMCYKCGSAHVVRLRQPYRMEAWEDVAVLPNPHSIVDMQCRSCKAKSHVHQNPANNQGIVRPGKSEVGGGTCFLCGVECADFGSPEELQLAFDRDRLNKALF